MPANRVDAGWRREGEVYSSVLHCSKTFGNENGKYKYEQSGRRKKESKIDN